MPGAWWTRVGLTAAALLAAVLMLLPTFYPVDKDNPSSWPGWYTWLSSNIEARITPGLDIQGGLHLQYQVDVDKAISDKLDRYVDELRRDLAKRHADAGARVDRVPGELQITVDAPSKSAMDLLDNDTLAFMRLAPAQGSGNQAVLTLDPAYVTEVKTQAIDQAIETIRKRIDDLGVSEPSIARRGETDLIVQMPGLAASQFDQAKALIGQTAQLEFKMLSDRDGSFWPSANVSGDGIDTSGGRPSSTDLPALQRAMNNVTPPDGTVIAFQQNERYNAQLGRMEVTGFAPVLLEARTQLTGDYITDARVSADPRTNRPVVNITFDSEGAQIFSDLTAANVGRQMAIVLDNTVNSAPVINERIPGGRAQISLGSGGTYNQMLAEAENLRIVLRNGSLPAPIEKQFETQVGPTLGADSVRAGVVALSASFVLIGLFMIAYYRVGGMVSVMALTLNVIFILATLALLGATMTLPGIAGITLTVGMAVDANVIIYERIREELRAGKSIRAAVDAGYEKAFSAIFDANVTTAIAGIVLATYGSGPIKGFAVTLLIGTFWSVISAVSITRLVYEYLLDGAKVSRLRI